MAEITIPAEVTPQHVLTHIVDFSERDPSMNLVEEITRSCVICLVYSLKDEESLSRVGSYWMPFIRRSQKDASQLKPVILVGNKSDLADSPPLDELTSIISAYEEIEAFIEVSALAQLNIPELFVSAQKAVLYPLSPLYDSHKRALTKKCRNALTRIFKLCDEDEDGLLSDHELNLFQNKCFGTPLQKEALDDLKVIIKQSMMDGIIDNRLTQAGFLFLHVLSIEKGKHDITWTCLRKFDYDDELVVANSSLSGDDDVTKSSMTSAGSCANASISVDPNDPNITWIQSQLNSFHNCFNNMDVLLKAGVSLAAATVLGIVLLRYMALKRSMK